MKTCSVDERAYKLGKAIPGFLNYGCIVIIPYCDIIKTMSHRQYSQMQKEYRLRQWNSPTTVMLTVALSPVPTLFIGTQVYTPSSVTLTLNKPELLFSINCPLEYNWYSRSSGLASVLHFIDRLLPRSKVVLCGKLVKFVLLGASTSRL